MRKRNGFTLIELLVVITIIVVLAGLLIPGVIRAMKQAKINRALSEMQHLATVITQIYSEVGYYVRLEDLTKSDNSLIRTWMSGDYVIGQSDNEVATALSSLLTGNMWNGPYTTYKSYATATPQAGGGGGSRPIDPWGNPTGLDADKALRQYRMFWTTVSSVKPVGASGAMVIISAGGDGVYSCNIAGSKKPSDAVAADFDDFNPSIDKGDDVYYVFNAGIQ